MCERTIRRGLFTSPGKSSVMFLFVAIGVLVCASLAQGSSVEPDGFKKLNVHDICFETKCDRYGSLYSYVHSGLVGALKLRYKSGQVRCVSNTAYNSRWGCGNYHSYINSPLNVVVTDRHNHVIYPKENIKNGGMWYWHPFVSDANSDEVVFTDFAKPFYLPLYGQIRIWYGEDLKNWNEGDNQGRVCIDVLAKFV